MNTKMIFQKKYVKAIKYVAVGVLFLVWIAFFDLHNLSNQVQYKLKINELEEQKAYYLGKIKEDSIRIHELSTNEENLEKYAREKYYMKKKGEEIFVIAKESKKAE